MSVFEQPRREMMQPVNLSVDSNAVPMNLVGFPSVSTIPVPMHSSPVMPNTSSINSFPRSPLSGLMSSPISYGYPSPLGTSPVGSFTSPAKDISPVSNSDSSLRKLQSNPMFRDLQKLLLHECSNLHIPGSLITPSWNAGLVQPATDLLSGPHRVYMCHMQLQSKFLQIRAFPHLSVFAFRLENYYCTEVGRIEMGRYQVMCASYQSEAMKQTVNLHYDKERLTLVEKIKTELDAILRSPIRASTWNTTSPVHANSSRLQIQEIKEEIDMHQETVSKSSSIDVANIRSVNNNALEKSVNSAQCSDSNMNSNTSDLADSISELFDSVNEPSSAHKRDMSTPVTAVVTTPVSPDNSLPLDTFSIDFLSTSSDLEISKSVDKNASRAGDCSSSGVESMEDSDKENSERKRKRGDHDDSLYDTPMMKKTRLLKPDTTRLLNEWYEQHIRYPYPSDDEVEALSKLCDITEIQIKKWMANKRVRSYNTLSISGNEHPIKRKFQGKPRNTPESDSRPIMQQLNPNARKLLNEWYYNHMDHPYPSELEKSELAQKGDVSEAQVKSWFANKRSRNNNTRKQVPNYFIKKYPCYYPIVEMVSQKREASRKRNRHCENGGLYAFPQHYY